MSLDTASPLPLPRSTSKLLVFTGKGGVGKTTCAAATALHLADLGIPSLIVSTDPAHSLGDCLEQKLGSEPTLVAPNLWGMELDALAEMSKKFDKVKHVLVKQMEKHGLSDLIAEEMAAFPGSEELFCLLKIVEIKATGLYKAIVLDTAPTGNTMRFLNFPEFLMPVQRALRIDRVYSRIFRPIAGLLRQETPDDSFYSSIFDVLDQVEKARHVLINTDVYFRFVLTPEKLALLETQRAVSFLNISGYTVDAILINKVLPKEIEDSFFVTWKNNQQKYIGDTEKSFHPLRILEVPLCRTEVLGQDLLRTFAMNLYGDLNPFLRLTDKDLLQIKRDGEHISLDIQIPYGERSEIRLFKKGQELLVNIGYYERRFYLPMALVSREVHDARYDGNSLIITFT